MAGKRTILESTFLVSGWQECPTIIADHAVNVIQDIVQCTKATTT